jgi:hypothetical protein
MRTNCLLFFYFVLLHSVLYSQEALKSVEEYYYDFLALQGLTQRPTLNYRTLSDSVWNIGEEAEHIWQGQNLGAIYPLFGDSRMRVYGPELFMSGNTAAPYGQNDGVLWQGRGFNASLKGGVRFEGYGIELTILPHFAFSQNAEFEIMQSAYDSGYGYFWGYRHNVGIDAPQRFGDKPFFDWDYGDSEIRYSWKTLTIGFGTQNIWLGSAYLNPILHSNNASSYPKFDIGLRKQEIIIPWINWYLGDVEVRLWIGQLSESKYFDNDDSNNFNMFHGFSFAFSPSFLPGLTIFANRTCLVPWEWENLKYIIPVNENTIEDQKASFGYSWIFPQVGLEIYGEIGVDDFVADRNIRGYIRYPFHTMLYTAGLKKDVPFNSNNKIYGIIFFEWNIFEMSQDFQFQWSYSPYFHHLITQGYTNKGQVLGAGTGWGGNSQYLEFKLYYPKGSTNIFFHRNNPDNNFIYSKAVYEVASKEIEYKYFRSWKANFSIGTETNYFLTSQISLGGGFVYNLIINPYYYYNKEDTWLDTYLHNFSLNLLLRFYL